MINERYGYYECSICGHKSQIITVIGLKEVYDEEGLLVGYEDEYDIDCAKSSELAVLHEEIHKKTK